MRKLLLLILSTFTLIIGTHAQKILLDGYVYEKYNRGFLNEVKIAVLDESEVLIGETISDIDGHFTMEVPLVKIILLITVKKYSPINEKSYQPEVSQQAREYS